MKDTRNRHYIKRPKYAPTTCKPYGGKAYKFAYAYIQKETGLEIVYKSAEPANVWQDLEGNTHKAKSTFYLSFAVGEYISQKIGVTHEDMLATEAENGYTDHLEAILDSLEIEAPDDDRQEHEKEKAFIKNLMKKATAHKAKKAALNRKHTEAEKWKISS